MSSSISNFDGRRGLLCALIAALIACCVILPIELRYRWARGGPIGIVPGLTQEEFERKIGSVDGENAVFVVGDSRVGWGFSETQFDAQLRAHGYEDWRGVNAGIPRTAASRILSYLALNSSAKGVVVINYSPAGMYFFRDTTLNLVPVANLTLQDVLDKKIEMHLRGMMYTKYMTLDGLANLLLNWRFITYPNEAVWVSRKCYDDGFVNAAIRNTDGSPLDGRQYQLNHYGRVVKDLNADPMSYPKRLRRFGEALNAIRRKGFKVLLVRFPIGERMKAVEAAVPEQYRIAAIANAFDIPYIDYAEREDTAHMDTIDESHLTPESARRMTTILANDVIERCLRNGQQ